MHTSLRETLASIGDRLRRTREINAGHRPVDGHRSQVERGDMEDSDLREMITRQEKVLDELVRVVYVHAGVIAEMKREFSVHYHREEGKTIPAVLRTGDLYFDQVTRLSAQAISVQHDPTPEIKAYESDPQAFLKSTYGDLFYWPWE
jgi:hypothetical protein